MRAHTGVWLALLASAVAAGCGGQFVYTVRPLPVIVQPSGESWGLETAVQFGYPIQLKLVNTSAGQVNVLWDESAYIDLNNRSHRVLTASAKALGNPPVQAISTVAPATALDEWLYPVPTEGGDPGADPVLGALKRKRVWLPWYTGEPDLSRRSLKRGALNGKQVGLFLVFERDGRKKTALAKYAIDHVARD